MGDRIGVEVNVGIGVLCGFWSDMVSWILTALTISGWDTGVEDGESCGSVDCCRVALDLVQEEKSKTANTKARERVRVF